MDIFVVHFDRTDLWKFEKKKAEISYIDTTIAKPE